VTADGDRVATFVVAGTDRAHTDRRTVVGRERWEESFPNVLCETRFREVTFHRKNFDVLGGRTRTFTTQNNPLIDSLYLK